MTDPSLQDVDLSERRGLLPLSTTTTSNNNNNNNNKRGLSIRRQQFDRRLHRILDNKRRDDWMRPYWLGFGLFLVLLPFWLLDSLKDPVFGALIDGELSNHLPTAKLLSVCVTLALVVLLEYLSHTRQRIPDDDRRSELEVLDEGGVWNRMECHLESEESFSSAYSTSHDLVPVSIFASIGVPYCVFFGLLAYLLQFNPSTAGLDSTETTNNTSQLWRLLGYCVYAAIESFGSLAVATFWSYANSTLSLADAEQFYGTIIAFAQMGAIVGSTMVTMHIWNAITLFIVACLVILLHILVMNTYHQRFPSTAQAAASDDSIVSEHPVDPKAEAATLWSGIYLILKHNYVLLILGVSCLYEVTLTCLNYQMTLLGWSRFEETPDYVPDKSSFKDMSFTQFMGHYGQMVNFSSLFLSSLVFPWLISRFQLKVTLRIFPTLLLVANILAFVAFPGNLGVLFFSMSLLKAMTYSIHDPSKELLYNPTSNAIKFKSKFWIDVVGARFAKAIGSSINHISGSVHRSIRVASAPSLLTAVALWYTCYKAGIFF